MVGVTLAEALGGRLAASRARAAVRSASIFASWLEAAASRSFAAFSRGASALAGAAGSGARGDVPTPATVVGSIGLLAAAGDSAERGSPAPVALSAFWAPATGEGCLGSPAGELSEGALGRPVSVSATLPNPLAPISLSTGAVCSVASNRASSGRNCRVRTGITNKLSTTNSVACKNMLSE